MKKQILFIVSLFYFFQSFSQIGTLDSTFKSYGFSFASISVSKQLSDGKILIGGAGGIQRLNSDGSLDASFSPVFTGQSKIAVIEILADGKILVAGNLIDPISGLSGKIFKLNTDGSVDHTFGTTGTGFDASIGVVVVQPDDKILVGGSFTSYNGSSVPGIARLNADGTIDTGFNSVLLETGTYPSISVKAIELQSDNSIFVGGTFAVTGSSLSYFVKLNQDGSLDTGYNIGTGFDNPVSTFSVLSSGKILVGGSFSHFNGSAINHFALINSDGTIDSGFNPGTGDNLIGPNKMKELPDGRILIAGDFYLYNNIEVDGLAVLNTDGSVYKNLGSYSLYSYSNISFQSDGKLLITGDFNDVLGEARNNIVRLNADLTLDTGFIPETLIATNQYIGNLALLSDGKIIAIGHLKTYNKYLRKGIVKLNSDGTVDPTFDPGTGFNVGSTSGMSGLAIQDDGKILVGGGFTQYNGVPRRCLARLNADGTLDTGFDPGTGANDYVTKIFIQSDGKIIIIGVFTSYNGTLAPYIARINTDGSIDTGFDIGTGPDGYIYDIAIQSDGKIIIIGSFTSFNGTAANNIVRLNSDGSVDSGFIIGTGADYEVYAIAIDNEKIYAAGLFSHFNGFARELIVCLNSDGSVDQNFNPSGFSGINSINEITIQPNGKILVTDYEKLIARLNADGSYDKTIASNWGGEVFATILQPDGKILLGGQFNRFFVTQVGNICRIKTPDLSTGLMNKKEEETYSTAYPNPVQDKLLFQLNNITGETTVQIFSITGVEMLRKNMEGNNPVVNMDNLPSGMYIYKITTSDGKVSDGRLIKK